VPNKCSDFWRCNRCAKCPGTGCKWCNSDGSCWECLDWFEFGHSPSGTGECTPICNDTLCEVSRNLLNPGPCPPGYHRMLLKDVPRCLACLCDHAIRLELFLWTTITRALTVSPQNTRQRNARSRHWEIPESIAMSTRSYGRRVWSTWHQMTIDQGRGRAARTGHAR
jgi:hypothetical protein